MAGERSPGHHAMKPVLKAVHSPDIEEVERFAPPDPRRFAYLLQLMIGPEGLEGEESFDVVICTADWLAGRLSASGVLSLRHHLLVDGYDWPQIRRFVEAYLDSIDADSWGAVAAHVGRLGKWEFEDYGAGQESESESE